MIRLNVELVDLNLKGAVKQIYLFHSTFAIRRPYVSWL